MADTPVITTPEEYMVWLQSGKVMRQVTGPADMVASFQHIKGSPKHSWQLLTAPVSIGSDMHAMLGLLSAIQDYCSSKGWSLIPMNTSNTPMAKPVDAPAPVAAAPTPQSPLAPMPPRQTPRPTIQRRTMSIPIPRPEQLKAMAEAKANGGPIPQKNVVPLTPE